MNSRIFMILMLALSNINLLSAQEIIMGSKLVFPVNPNKAVIDKKWIHGANDCNLNAEPAIEIFPFDIDTYILRQNKCTHYEAPFIYVLFGNDTVFVQDTGATPEPNKFPLKETIQSLIRQRNTAILKDASLNKRVNNELSILITHSHSHGDHKAADGQFLNEDNTHVFETSLPAIQHAFHIKKWPDDNGYIELGDRKLIILPIPGHQSESIAVYDPKTKWLLTGDTFYPGRLYVKNWETFKNSIHKLRMFTEQTDVSLLMGTHIEMSNKAGVDYPMGSKYQPNEAPLPLNVDDLILLDETLALENKSPKRITFDKLIVFPVK